MSAAYLFECVCVCEGEKDFDGWVSWLVERLRELISTQPYICHIFQFFPSFSNPVSMHVLFLQIQYLFMEHNLLPAMLTMPMSSTESDSSDEDEENNANPKQRRVLKKLKAKLDQQVNNRPGCHSQYAWQTLI